MGFLGGKETGPVCFGTWVFCRQIPSSGLRQKSAAGMAGKDSGLWGGVVTAETVRVSSVADSRTGAEATSRPIPGERL